MKRQSVHKPQVHFESSLNVNMFSESVQFKPISITYNLKLNQYVWQLSKAIKY